MTNNLLSKAQRCRNDYLSLLIIHELLLCFISFPINNLNIDRKKLVILFPYQRFNIKLNHFSP